MHIHVLELALKVAFQRWAHLQQFMLVFKKLETTGNMIAIVEITRRLLENQIDSVSINPASRIGSE